MTLSTPAPPGLPPLTDLQRMHAESVQEMRAASRAIRELLEHLSPNVSGQVVIFNSKPFPLKYKGRRHAYVWLPAQSVLTLEYPGMQGLNFTFSGGWNDFDYPEGTQISSAGGVTGYLKLTNEPMSAPQPSSETDAQTVAQGTSPWIVQVSNANANGQATMANSSPVVLASDQLENQAGISNVFITEDMVRNYTLAGKAFSATTTKNQAAAAATLGFQLFNPANSGKNILIYSLILNIASATFHDFRMTTVDVSSITGWTNSAITPVNNKGGGGVSIATCGYSNVALTGGLLGAPREVIGVPGTQSLEALSNGECIFLPASATINGIAVYVNATGTNNWSITVEYLEF